MKRILVIAFAVLLAHAIMGQSRVQFRDTSGVIVADSFHHNSGRIPMFNNRLVKYFKIIGKDTLYIRNAWTGDPHYICEYPREPLIPGKTYSITICFWYEGRPGFYQKAMGFDLSNGDRATYIFSGFVVPEEPTENKHQE
jgi:hypothetical protein